VQLWNSRIVQYWEYEVCTRQLCTSYSRAPNSAVAQTREEPIVLVQFDGDHNGTNPLVAGNYSVSKTIPRLILIFAQHSRCAVSGTSIM
jgi:hypothetical protein